MTNLDMSIEVAGINFPNPVLSSSGTFGFGEEFSRIYNLNLIGGLVTKSLRLTPWEGNPPPRVWETPCGLLNSVGIPSKGVENFARVTAPFLEKLQIPIIVSIVGRTYAEFIKLLGYLTQYEFISAIEVNVSCPNLLKEAERFDDNKDSLIKLVSALKEESVFPLFVKLSPADNIAERAYCAEKAGADALVIANTLSGLAIDIKRKRPVFSNVFAGLSGPAVKPIILKMVWQVSKICKVPIIASGGIVQGKDVLEYLMAGAQLVEVGTANFIDPYAIPHIIQDLENLLVQNGFTSLADAIGCARR